MGLSGIARIGRLRVPFSLSRASNRGALAFYATCYVGVRA